MSIGGPKRRVAQNSRFFELCGSSSGQNADCLKSENLRRLTNPGPGSARHTYSITQAGTIMLVAMVSTTFS